MSNCVWPLILTAGVDGYLVSFAESLSDPANRAAIAFRKRLQDETRIPIIETSTSLVSCYLRFDTNKITHMQAKDELEALIASRNWFDTDLPEGRRLWTVPTVYGDAFGPQLHEVADLAGVTVGEAIAELSSQKVRVQTIGFAPGMPYLGELPSKWNIPRQTQLTEQVPKGGLCLAIRQMVVFPADTPTGWRHIGQTAIDLFRPQSDQPFLFRTGDEVIFDAVSQSQFEELKSMPNGGAQCMEIS